MLAHLREHESHKREHELEERNRERVAHILDAMRVEARSANDLRLEGMNDLRRQLDRQANTFQTRDQADEQAKVGHTARAAGTEAMERRFVMLETWKANVEGRFAMLIVVPIVISMGAGIAAVLALFT